MTEGQAPSTARAAAGMGAVTAASRVLGFARVLVVLVVLGTTSLGNAFNSANLLSNVLFELLAAGALSAVLVPTFVHLLETGDRTGAEEVAGGVLGVALAGLGAVAAIGVVAAPMLARLLTIGVDPADAAAQRDLVTFLLRFFLPQVVLYAAGTIATAVLYSLRRFAITAAAPIGNTVVMVAGLVAFRLAAGTDPGLDLSTGERMLLVAAGTGGVCAFVGSLLIACRRAGFSLRPRWRFTDPRVRTLLTHSGWGVALHTVGGMLLGAAVIAGTSIEGGVVAYHSAWVFFLAPYGILAQPIHTAVLPELVSEARRDGLGQVAASLRWAQERMALFVLPVSAGMIALALPGMRLLQYGEVTDEGPALLAAALAGLSVGLYPYGVFLLLARGYYSLDDSRTPGLVALACGVAGVAIMVVGSVLVDGTARIAVLGLAHSASYGVGAIVLARGLSRRTDASLWSPVIGRMAAVATLAGTAAWGGARALGVEHADRLPTAAGLAGLGLVGALVIVGGFQAVGVRRSLSPRAVAG